MAHAEDPAAADAWVFGGEVAFVTSYSAVGGKEVPAWESRRLVPGFHLGANVRTGHVSFGVHAHWATLSMLDFDALTERNYFGTDLTVASFGPTIRLYPFGGGVAPFVGGGPNVQLVHFEPVYSSGGQTSAVTGAGVFAEAGVEFFRRSHVGMMTALRVDVPLFGVEHRFGGVNEAVRVLERRVVPVSVMIGVQFR